MRQFATIASNAFMELIRQPVFLLIATSSIVFALFLASLPYFGFGDDPKLAKDSVLALALLTGLITAVLSASNSVAREIRTGTALAVLAKPVSRVQFLLAKYAGLAGALTVLAALNTIAALLTSRMAYDAYGSTDWIGLLVFYGFVLLAYAAAGFSNFFLNRPFASDAVLALLVTSALAFVVINFIDKEGKLQPFAKDIDWRMIPASVLILFALWVLAGLALMCSTRLEMISSLAVCTGFFLLGLMSDYLLGRLTAWWAKALYVVIPNWQLFWMADALGEEHDIPWSYVAKAFAYTAAYVGAALAMALFLFEERELA